MLKFSIIELKDITKAWIAISLAFAILLNRNIFSLSFLYSLLISSLTVGLGFLLHELAHKLVAQRYHCFAEFRSFDFMLVLALIMSFFGFIFAAPGAVMINGYVTREKNGKISVAGPATNLVLALLFLILILLKIFPNITYYGFLINSWLALFNMIPFGNFDGKKVLNWSKPIYITVLIISIAFMIIQPILQ